MICKTCNEQRAKEDFLLGKEECYKCIYKKKMEAEAGPEKKLPNICKICGTKVKPPKTAFCCDECAQIGWKKQRKEYWPRNISSSGVTFKNWPI